MKDEVRRLKAILVKLAWLLMLLMGMEARGGDYLSAVAVSSNGLVRVPTNFWTSQTNDPLFMAIVAAQMDASVTNGLARTNWVSDNFTTPVQVAAGPATFATNIIPIVQTLSIVSNTVTLDGSLGNKFFLLLTTNVFFGQPINLQALKDYMVDIRQDGVGNHVVTWDTNYWKFSSGVIVPVTLNSLAWTLISAITDRYGTNLGVVQTLNLR